MDTIKGLEDYFQNMREQLHSTVDLSWVEAEEHALWFQDVKLLDIDSPDFLLSILQTEPSLQLRFEALRLISHFDLLQQAKESLLELLDQACLFPLIRRRYELLASFSEKKKPTFLEQFHFEYWFGEWDSYHSFLSTLLSDITEQGEEGLFLLEQILAEILDENRQLTTGGLWLFREIAKIFTSHRYFEGVQIFFDFLDSCRPENTRPELQKTLSEVFKAIRQLRPYRYPYWSRPLEKFGRHFQEMKSVGRAAEAKMLSMLISASQIEEVLLLEDDEIVDLLRGRRDSAHTEEDFEQALQLTEQVVENGREDARFYHILGWLKARLIGPDAAEPFFQKATALQADYVFSHMALASLAVHKGDEPTQVFHLEEACFAENSLISSFRQYGEVLLKEGLLDKALEYFRKGTSCVPAEVSVFELEEFFGCFVGLVSVFRLEYNKKQALKELRRLNSLSLKRRFGVRFVEKEKNLIQLFQRGVEDLTAEISSW